MRTGEGIVVLISRADRRIEALRQGDRLRDRTRKHHAGAIQHDGKCRLGEHSRGFGNGLLATAGTLEPHDLRQFDIDHVGPEIPRHVDLRGRAATLRLGDHPIEHLGNPGAHP